MKRIKETLNVFWQEWFQFPKYIAFHPFDGYDEFKRYGKGKMWVAVLFYVLYVFYRIFDYQYTSFLVADRNPLLLNSLQELFVVILLVFLFVVGNWSVTTLMEGKGAIKEIFMMTGYALFPLIILGFPAIVLSNFLTLDEMAFYSILVGVGYGGTAWMLFMGILNIHQYGLGKTILSIFLTLLAMSVMIFFGLLFFDLIQQFISFIAAIWQELSLR